MLQLTARAGRRRSAMARMMLAPGPGRSVAHPRSQSRLRLLLRAQPHRRLRPGLRPLPLRPLHRQALTTTRLLLHGRGLRRCS